MKFHFLLVPLAVAALSLNACREPGTEAEDRSNPYFSRAEKFAGEGNYNDAVAQYEQALQVNPAVAKAYQKLGDLYGGKLDDPVSAIYCYQKYLKVRPNAADRDLVAGRLDKAKRDLALALAPPPPAGGEDFARLNPGGVTDSGTAPAVQVEKKAQDYTVQKGDTLWNIAKKFYPSDTKGGIEKIKQANPKVSEKNLKIGATLVIPE